MLGAIASLAGAVAVADRRPSTAIQFGGGMVGVGVVLIVIIYLIRFVVPLLAGGGSSANPVVAVYAANLAPLVSLMIRFVILGIVLAAATGNAVNTFLLESTHRSVGASTAVFAALGIVAGYVWFGKLMAQDRWSNRYGPVVGGLALLMYTGTGGPNTDVGAHLLGFMCGFAAGWILIRLGDIPKDAKTQLKAGAAALGLIVGSWIIALTV